jgi:exodeoxyribonuclease VII large subunit
VVRGDGHVVTSKAAAEAASTLELQFADGRLSLGKSAPKKPKSGAAEQGSLF